MPCTIVRRIVVLTAILLAVCCTVVLAEGLFPTIKPWLWFTGFDRSPHAVRARFNQLARDWVPQDGRMDWPTIAEFTVARMTSEEEFAFMSDDERTVFEIGGARYAISGKIDKSGNVDALTIDVDPINQRVDQTYMYTSDQLIQITLLSMFDKLPEKTVQDLVVLYIYDVRPFNSRSIDQHFPLKTRQVQTVVGDHIVELSSEASEGDHLRFSIHVNGDATEEQIQADAVNAICNRKLSQANRECSDLEEIVRNLLEESTQEAPNWDNIQEVSAQLDESIEIIDELCTMLSEYDKTRVYASRMHVHCEDFRALSIELKRYINAREPMRIEDLASYMQDTSYMMQQMIQLLYN